MVRGIITLSLITAEIEDQFLITSSLVKVLPALLRSFLRGPAARLWAASARAGAGLRLAVSDFVGPLVSDLERWVARDH